MECVYIDIDSSSTYCSLISQQKMLQDNAAPETVTHDTYTELGHRTNHRSGLCIRVTGPGPRAAGAWLCDLSKLHSLGHIFVP